MFRRILVPLDGSGRAEQAIRVATRMAHSTSGSIVLLRVVDTSMEHHPSAPGKPSLLQSAGAVETRQAESYLGAVAQSDRFRGIAVQTRVVRGLVAPSILTDATEEGADIIVICSHGYSGITRWMLGSVAEKVAHYANVPVLILRESGPMPEPVSETGQLQVFIPLDGSAFAEAALAPAAQLATALTTPEKVTLHLTHIVRPGTEQTHEAQQYLKSTIELFRARTEQPFALTSSVVTNKDVANTIINVAEHTDEEVGIASGSRVIAMTTYGQGGQARWATGSIAGRILNATKLPLLIVRPNEAV